MPSYQKGGTQALMHTLSSRFDHRIVCSPVFVKTMSRNISAQSPQSQKIPAWVITQVSHWAEEHNTSPDIYEILQIKSSGYYLYIRRTHDANHTYIGAIKPDGIVPKKPRGPRVQRPRQTETCQHITAPTKVTLECSHFLVYEYGFSKSIFELVRNNPVWNTYYPEHGDWVLVGFLKAFSPHSYLSVFNPCCNSSSPKVMPHLNLGVIHKRLNSILASHSTSVSDIQALMFSVYMGVENGRFILSEIHSEQRSFCNAHHILLEELVYGQ